MKILLKSALILDKKSAHHLQRKDVLLESGKIKSIAKAGSIKSADKVIESGNLCVSIGFLDLNCHLPEPGFEHRESFETCAKAALNGGFTRLLIQPDTLPTTDNKSAVKFILEQNKSQNVEFLVAAALSKKLEGVDPTELIDMHQSGASAFSDGSHPVQNAGFLERALLYVKPFGGLVMNASEDEKIANGGQMNEGEMSVSLGLHAVPAIAESNMVARDIELLRYTDSRLHLLAISTEKSTELAKNAKKEGLNLSTSVCSYNLSFTDDALIHFDENLKVKPHLRTKSEVKALIKAIKNGTIDAVCSGHKALDKEVKDVEFDLSEFGMINLQTCFAETCDVLIRNGMEIQQIVELFTFGNQLLGFNDVIEEGKDANLTFFDTSDSWTFTEEGNLSKSKNSPYFSKKFNTQVLGTYYKKHINF